MQDFEDDSTPQPPEPPKTTSLGDRLLAGTGILLAVVSAAFPWYVFFNEDKFGIRTSPIGWTRDLPEGPPRPVFSVSPLAMVDNDTTTTPPQVPIDPIDSLTTATVSSPGRESGSERLLREDQPFPGTSNFRLMHVANGRALIQDQAGMYMVRVGSILPDNSRLASIEQRGGRWVIVTSTGAVYDEAATSGR